MATINFYGCGIQIYVLPEMPLIVQMNCDTRFDHCHKRRPIRIAGLIADMGRRRICSFWVYFAILFKTLAHIYKLVVNCLIRANISKNKLMLFLS